MIENELKEGIRVKIKDIKKSHELYGSCKSMEHMIGKFYIINEIRKITKFGKTRNAAVMRGSNFIWDSTDLQKFEPDPNITKVVSFFNPENLIV